MYNRRILFSLLFVVLVVLSVSAVSAEDAVDVLAADNAVDEVAVADAEVIADAQTANVIQDAIDAAKPGDTVKLNGEYDITNSSITISGKDNLIVDGQGNTTITGYGDGSGFFYVTKSASVIIKGINFIDNNPKNNLTYDGSVNGWGVQFNGNDAAGGVVDSCTFKDFSQAVVIKSCNNVAVKNNIFTGGYATKLVNDPTVNKEQGSKVISVGGSFFTTIENNVFDGVVLDAISIAQASGDAKIIGNTFKNNVYSIFFGGASTDGTFITNNRFYNCGSFNGTFKGKNVLWEEYPVISIQKAASGVYIDNNTFYAINNNFLIASEQGNAAHGYPSTLGDINVTNNKVVKFDEDADINGVTLLHILCRNGALNPYEDITVTGNEFFKGVTPLVIWSNDWGSENKNPTDIVIPAAQPVQTQIAIVQVLSKNVTVVLKDINGKGLAGQELCYSANEENGTVETDENGIAVIPIDDGVRLSVDFAGSKGTPSYAACQASIDIPATVLTATSLTTKSISVNALANGKLTATLVDIHGNPVANKTISVYVNGVFKKDLTTDEKGAVSYSVKYTNAGKYQATLYFMDDGQYGSAVAMSTITVNKLTTTLTAAKTTLKLKQVKKVKVTLKNGKNLIKGKKVTITVNGKTFSATTNAKGIATISVKVLKTGKFTATVKFAGDNTYKAVTKKVQYTVKK